MESAQSITKHPFKGNTAFILGNEVDLSEKKIFIFLLGNRIE